MNIAAIACARRGKSKLPIELAALYGFSIAISTSLLSFSRVRSLGPVMNGSYMPE
jgi:hypothetical protein